MHKIIRHLTLTACILSLTACGFFEKDNTPSPKPLTKFTPEIQPHRLWSVRTGAKVSDGYLKMNPAMNATTIFAAGTNGTITAVNKLDGHTNWRIDTGYPITTGPGIGEGLVVIGSRQGDVVAIAQQTGQIVWRAKIQGEILATPAVDHDKVVVKAITGTVKAFAARDGHELWSIQQVEPSLILRGSSAPLIRDHAVIVGFANGNLAKLNLGNGETAWLEPIAIPEGAFTIQRMIDIDADPLIFDHHLYAATYQGKIASLDWGSGKTFWSHDISSYTGMAADNDNVYVTDARSFVWDFNADSGLVNWRQTNLDSRVTSGPAVMNQYVVVGDAEGYLHWLDKRDGHFAAREKLGSVIYAAPMVDNNVLYALTNSGYLAAYTLS